MMDQILDIVIVNWNSPILLESCIASIQRSNIIFPGKLIVVDNSDEKKSLDVNHSHQIIECIKPDKNLGFGGGCNLGAAQGQAEFILFLNPDIYFYPATLQKLIAFLTSKRLPENVGIVGVQLIGQDGLVQKNVARCPRFAHLFPRMLALDRAFPHIFPSHYDKTMPYDQNHIVDQVPGAFFLVRRTLFQQLGGFDERFFMYYEDVDFSYRASLSGWKTLYLAEIAVAHQGGGATESIIDKRLFYVLRSRVLYTKKHYGYIKSVLVMLGILLLEFWARCLRAIIHGSKSELYATIKAYAMFLHGLPELLRR
jgi:hypothetical protein